MQVMIDQDEMALVFKNGALEKVLKPGRYFMLPIGQVLVEKHKVADQFKSSKNLEILLQNTNLSGLLDVVDVKDNEIALHFADGHFQKVLKPGKAAFWKSPRANTFQIVDFSTPTVPESISTAVLNHAELTAFVYVTSVLSFQKALVFFDSKLVKVLEPGRYFFWNGPTRVTAEIMDLRQQQLDMTGQEIMTQDKVTLRLNFICQYRIIDPQAVYLQIKEYEKQLYIQLQLILREYVGMLKLDELLEKKEEVGQFILERLKKSAGTWGIEFLGAGIKDVILPGEIKDILNKVIEAEKRAQANVITRREETASTRSLLNTVKLMEDNPLLVKLKEWEYTEAVAAKVGAITVSSSVDILTQLGKVLGAQK